MEIKIIKSIDESIEIKQKLKELVPEIAKAAATMINCIKTGNKILLCGNGGSAADSQHIAAELIGRFEIERTPIPCIALTTNTSILTAVGNDYDFSEVYKKQVEALANTGDVVIGISTSGNSENIIKALKAAKIKKAITIGLTGQGGKIRDIADQCLCVPSSRTCRIQEGHITIGHILCEMVEKSIAKAQP